MKKRNIFVVFLLLIIVFSASAFAGDRENVPLGDRQTLLFSFENVSIDSGKLIKDLEYDQVNQQLYVLTGNRRTRQSLEGLETDQLVFTMKGEPVANPAYSLIGNGVVYLMPLNRLGLEFDGDRAWSLEYQEGQSGTWVYNFERWINMNYGIGFPRGFAVRGDHFLYFYKGCWDEINYTTGVTWMNVDYENPINVDLDMKQAYGLSPDGREIIVAGTVNENNSDDQKEYGCYVVRLDFNSHEEIGRFFIAPDGKHYDGQAMDLYASEEEIVVMYRDYDSERNYIDRYSYEGKRIDGVEVEYCTRQMTEGPDGSTLYIQPDIDEGESYPLDVIQIDWPVEREKRSDESPQHLVIEKTCGGRTLAETRKGCFGLLKTIDQESGETDYRLPIRSDKALVKVKIPYGELEAKLDGARNVNVEYLGQIIAIPLTIFDCKDLLSDMPCQDDATFEISIIADKDGTVSYTIDLFVVDQTNAMTRVVHRKTIQ